MDAGGRRLLHDMPDVLHERVYRHDLDAADQVDEQLLLFRPPTRRQVPRLGVGPDERNGPEETGPVVQRYRAYEAQNLLPYGLKRNGFFYGK